MRTFSPFSSSNLRHVRDRIDTELPRLAHIVWRASPYFYNAAEFAAATVNGLLPCGADPARGSTST